MHIYIFCLLLCCCEKKDDSSVDDHQPDGVTAIAKVDVKETQWSEYSEWDNWPTFSYPDSFTRDPTSATLDSGEDDKWWIRFIHSNGEFTVSGSPRGWLDVHQAERQGIASPRELFLVEMLSQGASVVAMDGFEIFRQDYGDGTQYFYLVNDPEWGNAFSRLYFSYPKGSQDRYEGLMQAIKVSFIPPFKKPIK